MANEDNFIYINNSLRLPLSEINFRFSHSSGPGGQHVNKAETKVTVLFDVVNSPTLQNALSETVRDRLLEKLASRLNSEGVLQVSAQESRSQVKNRKVALARLQTILCEAVRQPKRRRKTRPSQAAQERRIQAKKQRGERKRERSRRWES